MKKHIQILKDIVAELNNQGRSLVVKNEHDSEEFIILRVREKGPRRFYGLLPGKPDTILYETPVKSEGKWGNSRDPQITEALKKVYGDSFDVEYLR